MNASQVAMQAGLKPPLTPAEGEYDFPPFHTVVWQQDKWVVFQGSERLGDHDTLREAFEKVAVYVLRISDNLL